MFLPAKPPNSIDSRKLHFNRSKNISKIISKLKNKMSPYYFLLLNLFPSFQCEVSELVKPEKLEESLTFHLKFFGESCNATQDCLHPFKCSEGKERRCSCPKGRIAQKEKSRWSMMDLKVICVIPSGGNCKEELSTPKYYFETIKGMGQLLWEQFGLDSVPSNRPPCVQDARCVNGTCVCNPGFYPSAEGSCSTKGLVLAKCTKDDECEDTESLFCNTKTGRCECSDNLTFDITTLQCHLPVDAKCDEVSRAGRNCIPNSECSRDGQVCECLFGYRKSMDGSCGLDYGMPCGTDHPCADTDLSCRSGRCQCKFWSHQYYDEESEECIGKVSAPCDLSQDSKSNLTLIDKRSTGIGRCTEGALCTPGALGMAECQCLKKYAEDETGRCVKSYGANCDHDSECDPLAQLVCVNSKCDCPDSLQVFDMEIRRCRGLLGSRCTNNLTIGEENFRETGIPTYCIENAFCQENVKGMHGRCSCKAGYEQLQGSRHYCLRKSSKFMNNF